MSRQQWLSPMSGRRAGLWLNSARRGFSMLIEALHLWGVFQFLLSGSMPVPGCGWRRNEATHYWSTKWGLFFGFTTNWKVRLLNWMNDNNLLSLGLVSPRLCSWWAPELVNWMEWFLSLHCLEKAKPIPFESGMLESEKWIAAVARVISTLGRENKSSWLTGLTVKNAIRVLYLSISYKRDKTEVFQGVRKPRSLIPYHDLKEQM